MAEVMLKQLTGGDKISARFMRRDFFDIEPHHKIWMAANHKPVIQGTDYAVWRRIKEIPFDVTIKEDEQDHNLIKKLSKELPGILAWAVQGALDWQDGGLRVPEKVKEATAAYKFEMDVIGHFIDERCTTNKLASVTATKLYEAYKIWAETNGEKPISQIAFSRKMRDRGYVTETRDNVGRWKYEKLGLKSEEEEIPPL